MSYKDKYTYGSYASPCNSEKKQQGSPSNGTRALWRLVPVFQGVKIAYSKNKHGARLYEPNSTIEIMASQFNGTIRKTVKNSKFVLIFSCIFFFSIIIICR